MNLYWTKMVDILQLRSHFSSFFIISPVLINHGFILLEFKLHASLAKHLYKYVNYWFHLSTYVSISLI